MDEADRAAPEVERSLAEALRKLEGYAGLPAGVPGECELCGEWSGRLIGAACAPCRDRYRLP
jgi:hypothetical protein